MIAVISPHRAEGWGATAAAALTHLIHAKILFIVKENRGRGEHKLHENSLDNYDNMLCWWGEGRVR